MRIDAKVKMADVLKEADAIDAEVILSIGEGDDGVIVKDNEGRPRVIVENHQGTLTVYIWEDPVYCDGGGDPRIFDLMK